MEGARLVSELIEKYHPKTILDLWAGKGYFSILAASYGAQVDAVEDTSVKNYDFVIAKHIVMYMDKSYVLEEFLPSIYQHLNRGGLLFLTYHHRDSELLKEKEGIVKYELNDFKSLKWNFSVKDFGDYSNPAPGINKEYKIGYIILQKN